MYKRERMSAQFYVLFLKPLWFLLKFGIGVATPKEVIWHILLCFL
jgi:hypothetical protein